MSRTVLLCPFGKVLPLLPLLIHSVLSAQFADVSNLLNISNAVATTYNGNGLSFYDFNLDGWDDLTIARGNGNIRFFLNQGGNLQEAPFSIPNTDGKQVMMVLWCDYDNDGDMDLLVTKENGPIELWQNNGQFSFTNVAATAGLLGGNYQHTGAAFADVNHDGFLDLYIAKFYHPALQSAPNFAGAFYLNNGDGTFTEATLAAGLYLPPRTIFQPVFLDYNNDGHPDLYLVTDRVFTENALFENLGDGSFINVSEASGAGVMICAMTGTVGDYNNDGHQDIYLTNSPPVGSLLLTNQGDGSFEENAEATGVHVTQIGWGSLWLDHNNDGWLDLFVSCTSGTDAFEGNHFFESAGGLNFSDKSVELGIRNQLVESYVAACGDLNHDGYPDFVLNNSAAYTPKLFRNIGGSKNHLSVSLEGTWSNPMGIGTRLICYADGHLQTRYTYAGENLLGQNGRACLFGLGAAEQVDSLVLEWNSGLHETYYDIPANASLHLVEGMAAYQGLSIDASPSAHLCPNDSVTLSLETCNTVLWSTGAEGSVLTVFETGSYSATCITAEGFVLELPALSLSASEPPSLEVLTQDESCYGEQNAGVLLLADDEEAWSTPLWSTGESAWQVNDLAPGIYTFTLTDAYACSFESSVELQAAEPLLLTVEAQASPCADAALGSASASGQGGFPPYAFDWGGLDSQALPPGEHLVHLYDAHACQSSASFTVDSPPPLQVLLLESWTGSSYTVQAAVSGGMPPYTLEWSDGQEGFVAYGLPAGYREVLITDANGCHHSAGIELETVVGIAAHPSEGGRWYPNPSEGIFFLSTLPLASADASSLIHVWSMDGRLVFEGPLQHGGRLDLGILPVGSYLIEWDVNGKTCREHLLVQR